MEEWKDIKGYKGLYQVSNEGRVKSLYREWACRNGGKRSHDEMLLSQANGTKGYKLVHLCKDGGDKTFKVHRLVAEAFLPESPDNLPQINHKDECKSNNSIENLEWCTNEYNNRYGTRILKSSKPVYQYTINNELINKYDSVSDAARLNKYSSIGNIY